MELSFANKVIRKSCEDEDDARAKYGPAVAKVLQNRLADLDAAESIREVLVGQPEAISGTANFKIDLCDGYRLLFCANHVNNPQNEKMEVDWERVKRIKILQIEKL